jgi:hypothetical protein
MDAPARKKKTGGACFGKEERAREKGEGARGALVLAAGVGVEGRR